MPNSTSGFSGNEIVTYVKNWIGNQSSEFQTFMEQTLPLAEYRFSKAHDWKFLNKQNLSLTVASGTNEYTLNTAAIGFEMSADDLKSVVDTTQGIYLQKTTLETIRRMDTKQDDGSADSDLTHWAPVGDNTIIVHPKTFQTTTLKLDGKITPTALHTLSNYPTIPYKYQDSFMQYCLALALKRENDDRADSEIQTFFALLKQDIANDMASRASSADEPRMKMWWEAGLDGVGGNLEQQFLDSLFR
jgi:hypothetical protein